MGDLLTPVSAYLRLKVVSRRTFLLESVEGGEKTGRYSFLGCDPFQTIRATGEQVEIENRYDEIGRISVEFSKADPNIIYTVIESQKTGLYRSLDKGKTWELKTTSSIVGERPFYFSLLVSDPVDTNRIYKPGFTLYVS